MFRKPFPIDARGMLFSLLFLAFVFALIFSLNMQRGLNHDEQQFVASGALLARANLLPYEDYAYFHTPYLTYVYGFLFRGTTYYLLTARLFSILCSFGLIITLYTVSLRLLRTESSFVRYALTTSSILLFLAAPIFIYTSGRAWNHDLPVLLLVWAWLISLYGRIHAKPALWQMISGILLGLAIGTRLSVVTALPAFLLLICLPPQLVRRQRRVWIAAFLAGLLLASLPLIYAFVRAPQAFLFGNLEYARLNTLYREATGYGEGMTAWGKVRFIAQELFWYEPGNLLLLILYFVCGLPRHFQRSEIAKQPALWGIGVLLPCLLIGSLAPTPARSQYFYLLFPFLWLGALFGLRTHSLAWLRKASFAWLGLVVVIGALLLNADEYRHLDKLFYPAAWSPVEVHQAGVKLVALLGEETKILTVAPILPLEGGAQIYPQLATGPFALRAASFLSKAEAEKFHLLTGDRLADELAQDPARAVLVGVDPQDVAEEAPLIEYARQQGYSELPLEDGQRLWQQPLAEWQQQLRLVAFELPITALNAGDSLSMMLYLENTAPLAHNINVIVRVVDAQGKVWIQEERWPWGKPTSTWQPHTIWFDGHTLTMPADAPPGFYRVEISFFDPETAQLLPGLDLHNNTPIDFLILGYLTVGNAPASPAQPLMPPFVVGEAATLLGVDLEPNVSIQAGDTLTLELYWQAQKTLATDYTAFVHLLGPDGQLIAQQDKQPLNGFLPTSQWRSGMIIPDRYELNVPVTASPGDYTLQVGLYDLATGQRLPIWRDGNAVGDSASIASIEVQ